MDRYSKFQDLPDILRVEEVAAVLRLSRSAAYELVRKEGFPVINPLGGKSMRIPKDAFIQWLADHTKTI